MIRVPALLLGLWGMQCLAAHAGLIDQVGIELRLDDNLARAELDRDITSDSTLVVSADAGAGYQVSDSDRLKLSFELSASAFRRYDGLDHVAARVTLTHRHKFGLGAYAPGTLAELTALAGDTPAPVQSADAMVAALEKSLAKQVERGKLTEEESQAVRGRVSVPGEERSASSSKS